MNDPYSFLTQEVISHKLKRIDEALLKLDGANASYIAPEICKDDLFDVFMEAREWLVTQLAALADTDADISHVSLEQACKVRTMRNKMWGSL